MADYWKETAGSRVGMGIFNNEYNTPTRQIIWTLSYSDYGAI